jgi:hypothetical protein
MATCDEQGTIQRWRVLLKLVQYCVDLDKAICVHILRRACRIVDYRFFRVCSSCSLYGTLKQPIVCPFSLLEMSVVSIFVVSACLRPLST